MEPHNLAKVMLVDGCFVLEILCRLNQFYCCKLWPPDTGFKNDISGIAHLVHLIHLSNVKPDSRQSKRALHELKRCATRLLAAGITIQPSNSSNPEDYNFVDKFDFHIKFQDGKLEMPALHIKEATEVIWRNLIAWEHSRIGITCKFTSYALFFQALICCEHGIKQLLKNKVFVNDFEKSTENLMTLFGTITEGAEHMDSSYSELCESLDKYQSAKVLKKLTIITWHQCRFVFAVIRYYWKNWYNILIIDHIPTVWKLIGVQAAMMLLALTIMQTCYAARSQKYLFQ